LARLLFVSWLFAIEWARYQKLRWSVLALTKPFPGEKLKSPSPWEGFREG
jgi:hypothetical protein